MERSIRTPFLFDLKSLGTVPFHFLFFSVTFTFADLAEEDDLMESVNKWFAGTSDHIDRQAADTTKYQGQTRSVKTRGSKLCN